MIPEPGLKKKVDIGGGNRVDGLKIDGDKAVIKELKPDNARQRRAGEKQLERYKEQLPKKFPDVKEVETVLDTYPPLKK